MLTILLSHERSGSHLLSGALASLKGVKILDEVCNPHATPPGRFNISFFRFFHEWAKDNPEFILEPSYRTKREFNKAYFEMLEECAGAPSVVVDIKYAHIHHFEAFWWPIFRRPFLFQCCEENGIKIIHLYRRNVLEAAVSTHVANKRKIWHSWQPEALSMDHSALELSIPQLVNDANLLAEQSSWMEKWAHGVDHLTVTYEEINSALNGDATDMLSRLAAHIGGEAIGAYKPKLKKLGRPLCESVANYEELVHACSGTQLEKML